MTFANENAKNVRKICEKVRNLMESKETANKYARHRHDYRRLVWSHYPDSIRTNGRCYGRQKQDLHICRRNKHSDVHKVM